MTLLILIPEEQGPSSESCKSSRAFLSCGRRRRERRRPRAWELQGSHGINTWSNGESAKPQLVGDAVETHTGIGVQLPEDAG